MNYIVLKSLVNSPELGVLCPALDGSQSLFGDTVVEHNRGIHKGKEKKWR